MEYFQHASHFYGYEFMFTNMYPIIMEYLPTFTIYIYHFCR